MDNHPEQKKCEVYLGNTSGGISSYLKSLKTIRLGVVSYDIHGRKITKKEQEDKQILPLFISKKEEGDYSDLMYKEMKNSLM